MRVVFLIPGAKTRSGEAAVATKGGRVLVATTQEEVDLLPGWTPLDLDGDGALAVSDWFADKGRIK